MMLWIIRPHDLPMSANADDEEPKTEAPEPETGHVGEYFEYECCGGVAHVSVGHYLWGDDISEVHEARDGEAGGTNGDELGDVSEFWMEGEAWQNKPRDRNSSLFSCFSTSVRL